MFSTGTITSQGSLSQPTTEKQGMRRVSSHELSSFSALEYEQSDLVWDILKSFSLLSVKDGKGGIHRLLSQALRASQTPHDVKHNINICVNTMVSLWSFQAEVPETWTDSLSLVEHVKSLVSHYKDNGDTKSAYYTLRVARLSIDAGVYSAMALNAFVEAQASLELALSLLTQSPNSKLYSFRKAQAQALHELGKIHRYRGDYGDSEQSLRGALEVYKCLSNKTDSTLRKGEADILHELGVLEIKKHCLDSAAQLLR